MQRNLPFFKEIIDLTANIESPATPLYLSAISKNLDIAKMLIHNGANTMFTK